MSTRDQRRRLYLFAFVDEFGPLYALYALWFVINGLTPGQVSWVYFAWASLGLVAEIPSGAIADRVDRRRLLAFALLLRAVGISLWIVWPTLAGVLVGAGLWAIHSALASGAWEALVYDVLRAEGDEANYGPVMARIGQASQGGVAAGIVLATVGLAFGLDIPALGWITVGVHAVAIPLILGVTSDHAGDDDAQLDAETGVDGASEADAGPVSVSSETGLRGWIDTMARGVRAAWSSPATFRLLTLGAVIEGLFILDEYQPLLAEVRGAPEMWVPPLVLAVWLGLILGGELAVRRPDLSSRTLGCLVIVGAAVSIAGIASGHVWPLALLGVGYAAQNVAWVLTDARFQAGLPDDLRATVTSSRAFFGGLLNALAFVLVGLVSKHDPSVGVMGLLGLLALVGVPMLFGLGDAAAPGAHDGHEQARAGMDPISDGRRTGE